jgi:hypothetical protein
MSSTSLGRTGEGLHLVGTSESVVDGDEAGSLVPGAKLTVEVPEEEFEGPRATSWIIE